jgi:hypothetical protein
VVKLSALVKLVAASIGVLDAPELVEVRLARSIIVVVGSIVWLASSVMLAVVTSVELAVGSCTVIEAVLWIELILSTAVSISVDVTISIEVVVTTPTAELLEARSKADVTVADVPTGLEVYADEKSAVDVVVSSAIDDDAVDTVAGSTVIPVVDVVEDVSIEVVVETTLSELVEADDVVVDTMLLSTLVVVADIVLVP